MELLIHPDPVALERELLRLVNAAHPRDAIGQTLLLVPTRRLAEHVQRRLADVRPAWLGLRVLNFSGLAHGILEFAGAPPLRVLSSVLLKELTRDLLESLPRNLWSRFVATRPGAVGRVQAALNDLREAGVDATRLAAGCRGPREEALAELYRTYSEELDRCRRAGWVDSAGLAAAALPHAPEYAAASSGVFVHGAYELVGAHLDLVRALDERSSVTALIPSRPGAPAYAYAERFRETFLEVEPQSIEDPGEAGSRPALDALYVEEHRPDPAPTDWVRCFHAQGEAAEVRVAVREALQAIREGCPADEIVITARTLEPYAAALEQALDDEKIAWTSSLTRPLRRQPVVHDFLLLLEVIAENFPRRATAELLRSPRLCWDSVLPGAQGVHAACADVWSRDARLVGGLEEWTGVLVRWLAAPATYPGQSEAGRARAEQAARRNAEGATEIGRFLEALQSRVAPGRRTWSEQARRLETTLDLVLAGPTRGVAAVALDALRGLLREMARLETVLGRVKPVAFAEVRRWIEDAVDGCSMPAHPHDLGGLRVIDAMQLRGLTARRVWLLGMNSGRFPRHAREDPVLPDDLRERLRAETGRPVPLKSAALGEERLLLALLLGTATEGLGVSWQRADESGRAKTASLALREVARLALGQPDLERLRDAARHVPSHPTQCLEELVASPGLLSRSEQLLLAALHGQGPKSALALARRYPELAGGLTMLGVTQAFDGADLSYDARVGRLGAPETISVSALEQLGRCPLQYFFSQVLRVRELDDQASPFALEARQIGIEIHTVLERTLETLNEEGLFENASADDAVARALALVERERPRILGQAGERLRSRLPVLGGQLEETWIRSVREFVEWDVRRMIDRGWRPVETESLAAREIDFGDGIVTTIRGRIDRRVAGGDDSRIGDYKTSGGLDRRMKLLGMLRGEALQVPLYWLISGESSDVELLGVGPQYDDVDDAAPVFCGFDDDATRRGFRETLRVLLALQSRGSFPFNAGRHCEWCAYRAACRRNHPPTLDREALLEDAADYRQTMKKTKKKPLLEQHRVAP